MRLAICYSGEPRDILQTIENHRTYLYRDHTVHIYIHAWRDTDKATPDEIGVDCSWKQSIPNIPTVTYIKTMRPYRYILESRTLTPQTWKDRQISMYHGIHKCIDLVDPTIKYDYILRIRPDVWFSGPVEIPEPSEPNIIYLLPNFPQVEGFDWDETNENVSDFFAICTPESIQKYRSFQFNTAGVPDIPIPTRQLGIHLQKHATIRKIPVYIHLYRNVVSYHLQ